MSISIIRNLVPVRGLTSDDIDIFEDLKIKANNIQLQAMIEDLQDEYGKRN